jgi:hypothetical protein
LDDSKIKEVAVDKGSAAVYIAKQIKRYEYETQNGKDKQS